MRIKTSFLCFLILFLLGTLSVMPQQENEPMTNQDVVALVKAGFSETNVILAIRRSDPEFDTSAEALIELKQSGVSEKIIEAMLIPRSSAAIEKEKIQDSAETGINEIILIDGDIRIPLVRSQMRTRVTSVFLVFGTSKAYRIFEGTRSQIRITNRSPVFEVSLPSDLNPQEQLVLVQLNGKSDTREVEIGRYSVRKGKDGFKKDSVLPTIIEEIDTFSSNSGSKYKLYRIKLVSELAPGEYAFAPRSWYYAFYDFGVD